MYISHAKLDQAKILISYLSNELLQEHVNQDSNKAIINNFLVGLSTRLKYLGQNKNENLEKISNFLYPGLKQDINEISKVAIFAIEKERLNNSVLKKLVVKSLSSMKLRSALPLNKQP